MGVLVLISTYYLSASECQGSTHTAGGESARLLLLLSFEGQKRLSEASCSQFSVRAAVFGECQPAPQESASQFQSTFPNTKRLLLYAHGPNCDAHFFPWLACDGFPAKFKPSRHGALRCNVPHRVVTPAVNTTPKGLPNLRKPGSFLDRQP